MNIIKQVVDNIRQRGAVRTVTVFPKGTVVKFEGIPCLLMEDCIYESATYGGNSDRHESLEIGK